ncbi:hypothetical protein AB0E67_16430 [Streptomyces sp. NPDC032161]|uniref:hypothetical protein n=1 Tax=unclassified Streptomyces TaxID=2593676 RepID=UPI0033EC11A8
MDSRLPTNAPTGAPTDAPAALPDAGHAAAELDSALRDAGLLDVSVDQHPDPQPDFVHLGPLSPAEANRLARLIRASTKRTLKAARALRDIVDAYRLDLPGLRFRHGRIVLGGISLPDAERFARLLGAPVPPDARTPRSASLKAALVGERLRNAFASATGGGSLDIRVRHEATGTAPVLELGSIDARTARRLVAALRF